MIAVVYLSFNFDCGWQQVPVYDVHTMTKSTNDAFLRPYPTVIFFPVFFEKIIDIHYYINLRHIA